MQKKAKATHAPGEFATELKPGEYRYVERRPGQGVLYFILPNELTEGYRDAKCIHRVPVGESEKGEFRWKLESLDPIHITPSVWYNAGKGRENGEWHGFLQDGHFVEV